jgi:hypothetical protein
VASDGLRDDPHSPRACLIADGYEGEPVLQEDKREYHHRLCVKQDWAQVSWLAICRELGPKGLKLRKAYWRVDGERLTTYVIARLQPANVVQHPAIERNRS